MNDFGIYFSFGLEHILTWEALDHILFVAALCLRYQFKDYKKIIVLITAFTIGHCSTLLLSSFNIISLKSNLIEFFIALTIICTAISNAFVKDVSRQKKFSFIYVMALLFGMIHGLGFAYGLKTILGKDQNIIIPLLAFNCGIEVAQIIVALVVLAVSYIFVSILKIPFRTWLLIISGIIFCFALQMAIKRNPFKDKNDDETTLHSFINDSKFFGYQSVTVLQ